MERDYSHRRREAEDGIADTPLSDGWHQPLTSHLQEMRLEDTRTLDRFPALMKTKAAV